jgi:antitoxin ParD1/3/4
VAVKLPERQVEGLDELVEVGRYQSRSAAVRVAVRDLLRNVLLES